MSLFVGIWASHQLALFGRPFVKRLALCHRTVLCPVCDGAGLWLNGWMDQHETWHAGRPRPWPHCARWGSSPPPPKGHSGQPPIFGPYLLRQMAGQIKMPLGMEVGIGQATVLNGDAAPVSPKRGRSPQFSARLLWPNGWTD